MDKTRREEAAKRINEGSVNEKKALFLIRKYKLNFCLYCESFTAEKECCGSATKKCKSEIER